MTFSYANVNKELCIRIHIESMEEGANSLEFDIPYTHTPGSVSHTDGMFICDGIMVLGWGEDKEFWLHADISTAKVVESKKRVISKTPVPAADGYFYRINVRPASNSGKFVRTGKSGTQAVCTVDLPFIEKCDKEEASTLLGANGRTKLRCPICGNRRCFWNSFSLESLITQQEVLLDAKRKFFLQARFCTERKRWFVLQLGRKLFEQTDSEGVFPNRCVYCHYENPKAIGGRIIGCVNTLTVGSHVIHLLRHEVACYDSDQHAHLVNAWLGCPRCRLITPTFLVIGKPRLETQADNYADSLEQDDLMIDATWFDLYVKMHIELEEMGLGKDEEDKLEAPLAIYEQMYLSDYLIATSIVKGHEDAAESKYQTDGKVSTSSICYAVVNKEKDSTTTERSSEFTCVRSARELKMYLRSKRAGRNSGASKNSQGRGTTCQR